MQGRSRDAEAENGCVDPVGEGAGGMSPDSSTDMSTSACAEQTASGDPLQTTRSSAWSSAIAERGGLGLGREARDGGYMYTDG